MMKLTTNRNYKAVSGAVFALLVCAGSFVPTPVYAEFGAAELWSLVNAGLVSSPAVTSLKNSVVERYTSLSPGELTMLEYELGAVYTVGSVMLAQDWASQYGATFDSLSGAYCVTGLCRYYSNNLLTVGTGSIVSSENGLIFNSDFGSFGILPVNLNGRSVSSTLPGYCLLSFNGASDFQLSFDSSGGFDFANGVCTFSALSNPVHFAYGGTLPSDGFTYVNTLPSISIVTSTNPFQFSQSALPCTILGYVGGSFQYDSPENPMDVYNQAYQNALNDYPEYIENWVDLEDDFNATEPAVFDSLEFPPYIPNVDFHDVEVPTETLPTGLTDGAGFWFSAFSNMVDTFNLKPYVILFLCIMLVMVILKI